MRMRIVTYQSQLQLATLIVPPVLLVVLVIILVALILISINFLLAVVVVLDTLCMLSASFAGANSQFPTPPVEYKILKYFAIRRHVRTRLNLAKD